MAKYAEIEWKKKEVMLSEERILINPLDPVYKELLQGAGYDEEDILSEIEKRFGIRPKTKEKIHPKTKEKIYQKVKKQQIDREIYNPPEKEVFYQLFPLVSVARKGSRSREAALVLKMISFVVKRRLWYALDNPKIEKDVLDSMNGVTEVNPLSPDVDIPREDARRLIPVDDHFRYMVRWACLSDYDLTQHYIVQGWVPLTKIQLIEAYALLLKKTLAEYIDQKRAEYASQNMKLPPFFGRLLHVISSQVPAVSVTPVGATELEESAFPPCIREALQGVSSGLRNYAITVLLTSFLSYARVYPSLSAFDQEKKPEISSEQIEILLEEVVPLIIEAGDRCDPPLFADQPIERLNVFYHLGFGLNDSPTQTSFGTSKWYLPPSCKKIRQNAPSLCKPDALCSQGVYAIADRKRLEHLIDINAGDPQKVLLALRRSRNPQKIVHLSGVDKNEVERIVRNLEKEGILIQIRVRNPLVYYVRKMRRKKGKRNKRKTRSNTD